MRWRKYIDKLPECIPVSILFEFKFLSLILKKKIIQMKTTRIILIWNKIRKSSKTSYHSLLINAQPQQKLRKLLFCQYI